MKYIDSYEDSSVSFWEKFPYFREMKIFKPIYTKDRSFNKNNSSKLMWFLVFCYDPDSEFEGMDVEDQEAYIFEILDIDLRKKHGEDLDVFKTFFRDFLDSAYPLLGDVRAHELKLKERSQFIQDTPYTIDKMIYPDPEKGENFKPYIHKGTAVQLDRMFSDSKKIHQEVRELRAALKSEQAEKGKGGQERSFVEKTD